MADEQMILVPVSFARAAYVVSEWVREVAVAANVPCAAAISPNEFAELVVATRDIPADVLATLRAEPPKEG